MKLGNIRKVTSENDSLVPLSLPKWKFCWYYQKSLEKQKLNFVCYFSWELELFSNILWVIVKRGSCQGDPVSAYLFMLEILCPSIKKHPEIKGIEIFEHCLLYTAYADITTFFFWEKAIHWEASSNI